MDKTYIIGHFQYKPDPHSMYALYRLVGSTGSWKQSASIQNTELTEERSNADIGS